MSEWKPLPCPFCDGINIIHCAHHMYCHACGADGPDADSAHESEALEAWNRRAQPAPITSESGNQAAQGASAITSESVPLSDGEIDRITDAQWGAHAQHLRVTYRAYARAVEQAVRAKMGSGVPMTRSELVKLSQDYADLENEEEAFRDGWRRAELHHGIVGKEGGND